MPACRSLPEDASRNNVRSALADCDRDGEAGGSGAARDSTREVLGSSNQCCGEGRTGHLSTRIRDSRAHPHPWSRRSPCLLTMSARRQRHRIALEEQVDVFRVEHLRDHRSCGNDVALLGEADADHCLLTRNAVTGKFCAENLYALRASTVHAPSGPDTSTALPPSSGECSVIDGAPSFTATMAGASEIRPEVSDVEVAMRVT